MFPNRVLMCCVVACWCAPAPADEKPLDPRALLGLKDAPKKPAVIPVSKALDLDEVTKSIRKLFPAGTVIVPLPDEHALLVYVTEAQAKEIQLLAKPLVEKAPATKPMVPPMLPPLVEPKPVPESTDPVLKVIALEWRKAEEVADTIRVLVGDRVQVIVLKAQNRVVVLGSPRDVALAVKIAEDQDRPLLPGPPRLAPVDPLPLAPMPRPVPKTYTMHFKAAEWDDVLDWYAQETGLTLITTVKPTGLLTIVPPAGAKYTIGEVTDLINEAMMQQKFILIRRTTTFLLHPADEKMDPAHFTRVTLAELPELGRTEFVQVLLPVEGIAAADALDELKKLLTPFGTMTVTKDNCLLISDTVGNIVRIQKTLDA